MVDFYLNTAAKALSKYNEAHKDKPKKYHRCIAALICHPTGKDPYVAVLCTGTKMNDGECHSTKHKDHKKDNPCEGHAASLCYEVAPIYFQQEMQNCINGKESIFEHKNDGFSLKSNIAFHLLVTEPPCGWIRNQEVPCMQWKQGFKKVPHIPTCSSKILIGSQMGIQGYVSHLMEDQIFIQSVTILCEKNVQYQKTNFTSPFSFELPKISTLVYDLKQLNQLQHTFKPMNLIKTPANIPEYSNETTHDGIDHDDDKNPTSFAVVDQSIPRKPTRNWLYSPHDGEAEYYDNTVESMFSVSERKIDDALSNEVNKEFQVAQKRKMKEEYDNLSTLLNLPKALQKFTEHCEEYKTKKEQYIKKIATSAEHRADSQSITDTLIKEVQNLLDAQYKCSIGWVNKIDILKRKIDILQNEGKKLIDVQNWIADLKEILKDSPNDVILDCSWERYFDES